MNLKKAKELRKLANWHPNDGKGTEVRLGDKGQTQLMATNTKFLYYKSLKQAVKKS